MRGGTDLGREGGREGGGLRMHVIVSNEKRTAHFKLGGREGGREGGTYLALATQEGKCTKDKKAIKMKRKRASSPPPPPSLPPSLPPFLPYPALAARYSFRHPHGRGSALKEALLTRPRRRRQEGGTVSTGGGREGGREGG